ncbi:unnamed protein product [Didymodactylos carnosus]|uniref:G-protein coupled receptors family 1 profile domain-containing protein n=1 Tax=Didymodactylos carnosus TaxID=1234261 RepID=A0A814UNR0_9BILA|nr:unnamed protein product [Didymodactylos carnosus]CAF1581432.1 unnamed protein product [Didymodactylos carnosus]CAF3942235.1 unnamed protein product [Didymodactylos carnosus]CAF4381013.1 unnamed protein product [Didymodactylos carnosus]
MAVSCWPIFANGYQYENESRLCTLTSKNVLISSMAFITIFLIPYAFVILLYTLVLYYAHITKSQLQHDDFRMRTLKRNMKIFKRIIILVLTLSVGGFPYIILILLNYFTNGNVWWPFYSIGVIFIPLSTTIATMVMFFTNKTVKTLLYTRLRYNFQNQQQRTGNTITMITNPIFPMP